MAKRSTSELARTQSERTPTIYLANAEIMASILARTSPPVEATCDATRSWRESMKSAIRSSSELCGLLDIDQSAACPSAEVDFPVFVPREFVAKMEPGNPRDPLLLQVLAGLAESEPGGSVDAVGDAAAALTPGVLKKYSGRCLVIATGACAVHCRYCFRRHYPYSDVPKGSAGLDSAVSTVARDKSLEEIILSGGDPLTLPDESLLRFIMEAGKIEHLRRIRIHTRLPAVIPHRVCDDLIQWVERSRLPVYFVMHFNHANEICSAAADAMQRLHRGGATLLNQAVLLRGVNDTLDTQIALCKRLLDVGVLPYYLHQLDRVQGTLHFEVPVSTGKEIAAQLRDHLPGYGVPQYVQEIVGNPSKTPL